MKIEILGGGCARCKNLAEITEGVAKEMGVTYEMEKVTDMATIAARGIMQTPALAIDGVIKCMGRIPSSDEIKKMLS